jgi:hypothetical protein
MYCSECGQQATGKFCSNCGSELARSGPLESERFDWRESFDYERIIQVSEVRRRMEQAKESSRRKVSSSKLLGLVDAAAAPLMGGLSSVALAKIAQPLAARIGLKTGKDRQELVTLPPGEALANLAVSMASVEHTIVRVDFDRDQCQIEATLPADLRAMESRLTIELRRAERGTLAAASAMIEGQWYDWGKCQSNLDYLFTALRAA